MKISYDWLQNYFDEKLPVPEKLSALLTAHFAEVESVEKVGDDAVFDIKILPDRACYALSHRGIAGEVAAETGLARAAARRPQPARAAVRPLAVRIEAEDLCPRYMARVIENISLPAPERLAARLSAIGQRPVHPAVDAANFTMFDMGQPLHVFDADKVEGGIVVRRARKGERLTTLDRREIELDEEILVIADEKAPLAIAGIKGGTKAEVGPATRNLILESANFDPSCIRRTSQRLGIRTDAAKRYENGITPERAAEGMSDLTALLFEMDADMRAGEIADAYPAPVLRKTIPISADFINARLGLALSRKEITGILRRIAVSADGLIPFERLDLKIPEDLAEEVGRLYGYGKIPAVLPPPAAASAPSKIFYYESKVREALLREGFSEVMTSSFADKGEAAVEKPLAEDKKYLRPSLERGIRAAFALNVRNAPLIGIDKVNIFEIGKVFGRTGERTVLGVMSEKDGRPAVERALGAKIPAPRKEGFFEIDLGALLSGLPEPAVWDISSAAGRAAYRPLSIYPFVLRDIAVFVPEGAESAEVLALVREEAGPLLAKDRLFDVFRKGGMISYAFRLAFQSREKTLSDAEVNAVMERVSAALNARPGWRVR